VLFHAAWLEHDPAKNVRRPATISRRSDFRVSFTIYSRATQQAASPSHPIKPKAGLLGARLAIGSRDPARAIAHRTAAAKAGILLPHFRPG